MSDQVLGMTVETGMKIDMSVAVGAEVLENVTIERTETETTAVILDLDLLSKSVP
jgi:hypothetical protein